VRESLGITGAFSTEFGAACDRLLSRLANEHPGLTIAAMGSYAEGTLSLESDLDVVFLIADPATEKTAHAASTRIAELRTHNSPIVLDLRLRPEGRQGPLGVTLPSLRVYAGARLEAWERLAAGRARLVAGSEVLFREFQTVVLGSPLTEEDRSALRHIKSRVEQERAQKRPGFADIKLGPGGLDDIAWGLLWLGLHHLPHSQFPRPSTIPGLAAWAESAGHLSGPEARLLSELGAELARIRVKLALLGQDDTLMPLEADKLELRDVQPGLSERLAASRKVAERLLSSC
jgi:glutamate-ammonia-ligase adenylyltransferase